MWEDDQKKDLSRRSEEKVPCHASQGGTSHPRSCRTQFQKVPWQRWEVLLLNYNCIHVWLCLSPSCKVWIAPGSLIQTCDKGKAQGTMKVLQSIRERIGNELRWVLSVIGAISNNWIFYLHILHMAHACSTFSPGSSYGHKVELQKRSRYKGFTWRTAVSINPVGILGLEGRHLPKKLKTGYRRQREAPLKDVPKRSHYAGIAD